MQAALTGAPASRETAKNSEPRRYDHCARRETHVRGKLHRSLTFGVAVAAIAIGIPRNAAALVFEDISGKWCGSASSYTFAPGTLTVIVYADGSRHQYKIDNYEYTDEAITVNWERDGDKLFTSFSEFSGDGSMVQVQNDVSPRREFRRCT
jgi:hypothetical protein